MRELIKMTINEEQLLLYIKTAKQFKILWCVKKKYTGKHKDVKSTAKTM